MLIIALLCGAHTIPFHYTLLRLYQLSGYRAGELISTLAAKRAEFYLVGMLCPVLLSALSAVLFEFFVFAPVILLVIQAVAVFLYSYERTKTKIAFTARFIRFLIALALFSAALVLVLMPLLKRVLPLTAFVFPISFLVAHALITPIERARNARFIKRAKAKLDAVNPIRIGVTGSYGKTTAKNILAVMLKSKYTVLVTPENYNTPMGIAKTLNGISPDTQIFIAEMGARYKGDIKELCDLVRPRYAMLTAIGTQHLQTFGSTETLMETKNELITALPNDGFAVFNGENEGARELARACPVRCVAPDANSYGSVTVSLSGTTFTLKVGNESVRVNTKLLGRHIPSVISQCAALAYELGISVKEIKKAVSTLKPVAHRLEMLYNGNDIIIDDAYNGNETGARVAIDILSDFSAKVRVLVTPGVVELGKRQESANREIGEYCAGKCDYALFVGENAPALLHGAKNSGHGNAYAFPSLAAAMEKLKTIKGERAILFENDLPDEN